MAAVEALRREVDELEVCVTVGGDVNPPRYGDLPKSHSDSGALNDAAISASPATLPASQAADQHVRKVQRALEICDEARKCLLSQTEAACSLDKCQVVAANALLSGVLGATTDHARRELVEEVRRDLRRFLRCFAEVVENKPTPPSLEELNVRLALVDIEEKLDGRWFTPGFPGSERLDELHQTLSMAAMLLEKRLNDAKREGASASTRAAQQA